MKLNHSILMVGATLCFNLFGANTPPEIQSSSKPFYAIVNLEVELSVYATDADGDALTFTWAFGDGSTGSTSEFIIYHTYAAEGIYDASVVVSDGVNSVTGAVQVVVQSREDSVPAARCTASKHLVRINELVEFDATPTLSNRMALNQLKWFFGDGTNESIDILQGNYKISKSWSEAGIYNVNFLAVSEFGFFEFATISITVVNDFGFFVRYNADLVGNFQTKTPSNATFNIRARISADNFGLKEGDTIAVELMGERFESTLKKNFKAKGWKITTKGMGYFDLEVKVSKKRMGEGLPKTTIPVFFDLGIPQDGQHRVIGIPFDTYYEESGKSKMKFFGRF